MQITWSYNCRHIPRRIYTYVHPKAHTRIFIVALFITAKRWECLTRIGITDWNLIVQWTWTSCDHTQCGWIPQIQEARFKSVPTFISAYMPIVVCTYESINKNAKQTKLTQAARSQDSGYAGMGVTERKQERHSWGVSDKGTGLPECEHSSGGALLICV